MKEIFKPEKIDIRTHRDISAEGSKILYLGDLVFKDNERRPPVQAGSILLMQDADTNKTHKSRFG